MLKRKKSAPSPRPVSEHRYIMPAVSKALLALEVLQGEPGPQKLDEIHSKTNIPRGTLYRILKTLVFRGYAIETRKHTFVKTAVPGGRRIQIGFGVSGRDRRLPCELLATLRELAEAWGVSLLALDNEDGKGAAIRNVKEFIRERVDVVFESSVDPEFAPTIAEMLCAAGKPTVAVENPIPDATYFGTDNYRAGFDAGERLAQFAERRWEGEADCFVGACSRAVDSATHRAQGAYAGVCSTVRFRSPRQCEVVAPTARNESIADRMRTFLARCGPKAKVLILAADHIAEAEVAEAVRCLQRDATTAIAGFRCEPHEEGERLDVRSGIVASVYCDSCSYAKDLLQTGLAVRAGKAVPPYNYAKHIVVDRASSPRMVLQSDVSVPEESEFESAYASSAS